MGIYRTDYVMIGLDLQKDFPEFSLYEHFGGDNDAYDKIDDLTNISQTSVGILEDGMGGQYTAVGILLAPPAEENGLDWFETDIASIDLQEKYTKVVEFCETHFGLLVYPKLIAFTNWW